MQTSKYKSLKFATDKEFYAWLKEKTRTEIELKDLGHDLIKFWIDEHGEILDCNAHQHMYIGKFITNESFKIGDALLINKELYRGLIIEQITVC